MCMKCKPTSVFGNLWDIFIPHLSHVPQHGEDDKPRHKAGQAVHGAGDQSISATEDLTLIRESAPDRKGLQPLGLQYRQTPKKARGIQGKNKQQIWKEEEKNPITRDDFFFFNPYRWCNISLPLDWMLAVSWCFKIIGITITTINIEY